jgi:hypothetical protein
MYKGKPIHYGGHTSQQASDNWDRIFKKEPFTHGEFENTEAAQKAYQVDIRKILSENSFKGEDGLNIATTTQ